MLSLKSLILMVVKEDVVLPIQSAVYHQVTSLEDKNLTFTYQTHTQFLPSARDHTLC